MTSIEFRPVCTFTSPLFSTQKSSRRAVREGVVTASVTLFIPQRGFLFVGVSDGKILCWDVDKFCVEKRAKESKPRMLEGHAGEVRCMTFVESLWQGVLLTGSADRCIKMWDLSDPRGAMPCVHSLYGHGGTVLTIEFGADTLLSASTDGYMFIWRDQSPVKLLRFPAYTVRQKISANTREAQAGSRGQKDTWFLSLSLRDGEAPSIFASDTEGYVHVYKPETAQDGDNKDVIFLLERKMKIHDLGIPKLVTVPMESFIFTLSFDQTFKTLDGLSGQTIFEESNQCNAVFTSIAFDSSQQDVIVADEKGNIGFYNLYMESCVAWRNLTEDKISQIHYDSSTHRLLMLSPHALRVVDVVRGVKFSELTEHEGPVVAMASRPTSQGGLLYTAAMDNTIRMWDADSLECIKTLKESKHEITAMVYLPIANVIITGHENSDLKLWSIDSLQESQLKTSQGQSVHENTISILMVVNSTFDESSSAQSGGYFGTAGTSAGCEILVAGSYDRQLSFWKVTTSQDGTAMAKFERAFSAHDESDDEILAMAHTSISNSIFTGGNAGIIRKWAFWGLKVLEAEYEAHTDAITCFAVDANFLFSGSVDKTIRVWETHAGQQLKVIQVHDVAVQSLLLLRKSGLVASCAFDGRVVFWDPQIGREGIQELQTYEQPQEFRALAYVDLTHTILVGCESGKIVSFPLPSEPGKEAEDQLPIPPAIQGMETPPSSRCGESRESILETLRKSPKPPEDQEN
jgi:WD40 repeat protein